MTTDGRRSIVPLDHPPDAVVPIPGSKSHTNRALACAALAEGPSVLDGALFADDTEAMVAVLEQLGVGVRAERDEARITVDGGLSRFAAGPRILDANQSGTTGRFMAAVASLGPGPYELTGDAQLRGRPFDELTGALRSLGAEIEGDRLPLHLSGGGLRCGPVTLRGSVSSQFLSALLLAAPHAEPATDERHRRRDRSGDRSAVTIELTDRLVSRPYVELTVATMATFGVEVGWDEADRFRIAPQRYRPQAVRLEPDASAASYFFAAAAITGGRVRVEGLGTRTVQGDLGFVDVLERMGATVERGPDHTEVTGTGTLRGVEVDMADMSDVAQTLAVTATFAAEPTTVTGIGFIARKETDRIRAVVEQLSARGIEAHRIDDGFVIHPGTPRPGVVATYDDHRMAMSFALLGLVHPGIEIADPHCVAKTFPDYFAVLDRLR